MKVLTYGGKTYIIDGHHKVNAAIRLGKDVPVVEVSLAESGYSSIAEIQTASYNALQGSFKVKGNMLNNLLPK